MIAPFATRAGMLVALFALPLAASAQTPAPAMAAMPAMDTSKIDCSTASEHMKSMMTAPASSMSAMPADTDKTYTDIMKMMVTNAAMLSKIEMKCGKNAKAMAMAHKMMADLEDQYLTVEAVQNGF